MENYQDGRRYDPISDARFHAPKCCAAWFIHQMESKLIS